MNTSYHIINLPLHRTPIIIITSMNNISKFPKTNISHQSNNPFSPCHNSFTILVQLLKNASFNICFHKILFRCIIFRIRTKLCNEESMGIWDIYWFHERTIQSCHKTTRNQKQNQNKQKLYKYIIVNTYIMEFMRGKYEINNNNIKNKIFSFWWKCDH